MYTDAVDKHLLCWLLECGYHHWNSNVQVCRWLSNSYEDKIQWKIHSHSCITIEKFAIIDVLHLQNFYLIKCKSYSNSQRIYFCPEWNSSVFGLYFFFFFYMLFSDRKAHKKKEIICGTWLLISFQTEKKSCRK